MHGRMGTQIQSPKRDSMLPKKAANQGIKGTQEKPSSLDRHQRYPSADRRYSGRENEENPHPEERKINGRLLKQ